MGNRDGRLAAYFEAKTALAKDRPAPPGRLGGGMECKDSRLALAFMEHRAAGSRGWPRCILCFAADDSVGGHGRSDEFKVRLWLPA